MQRLSWVAVLAVIVGSNGHDPAADGAIGFLSKSFGDIIEDYKGQIVTEQSRHDGVIDALNTEDVTETGNYNQFSKEFDVETEIAKTQRELEENAKEQSAKHTKMNETVTSQRDSMWDHFNSTRAQLQADYNAIQETITSLDTQCDNVSNSAPTDTEGNTLKGDNHEHNDKTLVFLDLCAEILNKLRDDLREQNDALQNNENARQLATDDAQKRIAFHKRAIQAADAEALQAGIDAGTAEGKLPTAASERDSAERELEDNKGERSQEIARFNEDMSTLQAGLAATEKAKEILDEHIAQAGGKIEGADTIKADKANLQVVKESLLQKPRQRTRLLHLLNKAATVTHSRAMKALVREMTSGPATKSFLQKAVDMVQKMIQQLNDEQRQEDEKKAWCDDNIARTEQSIETLNASKAQLEADDSKHDADIEQYDGEIERSTDNVNELTRLMEKNADSATLQEEECDRVVKEHKAAMTTVDKVKWEVRDQLKKQSDKDEDRGDEIVGAIDQAVERLKQVAAETKSACTGAANKFAKNKRKNTAMLAENEQHVETSTDNHERENREKEATLRKLATTKKELDLANQYAQELEAPCTDGESDYANRKASRTQEREALESVIPILECDIHDEDQDPACENYTMF